MDDGVRVFLENLGMVKHYEIFCAKGFDSESDIPHICLSDLEDSMMIESSKERTLIHFHAQKFKPSSEHTLYEWLRRHALDHYYINFIQSELTDLNIVAEIQLPNEDLYDELEIVLPGHKRRLERAVAVLREEKGRNAAAEIPVTQGWWGKPDCLPQAKFDFLCVTANLFSSREPNNKAKIDFMVDSGSDVSTVQEKTLEGLNLDLLGRIYSCGIHGGNYTNLYKAQLEVGDEKIDIEVMASNYDSLGSRIIRHFRHVIDGNRHIWLKGNYKDPLPAILPLPMPPKPPLDTGMKSLDYKPTLTDSTASRPPPAASALSIVPSAEKSTVNGFSTDGKREDDKNSQHINDFNQQSPVPPNKTQNDNEVKTGKSSSHQTESGSEKKLVSNGFVSLSSLSKNKDGHVIIQSQTASKHRGTSVQKKEATFNSPGVQGSNYHISCNCVQPNVLVSGNEENLSGEIKVNDQTCNQSSGDSLSEAGNNNSQYNGFDIKQLDHHLVGTSDSKSSGLKRHASLSSHNSDSAKKVRKMCDNIPQVFKDTDDDIDNMNPFQLNHSKPCGSSYGASYFPSNPGVREFMSHCEKELNNGFNEDVNILKSNEQSNQEEVIHILSENEDAEESFKMEDGEAHENGIEYLGQNSNFMPGHGISVMIAVDDLETSELHGTVHDET